MIVCELVAVVRPVRDVDTVLHDDGDVRPVDDALSVPDSVGDEERVGDTEGDPVGDNVAVNE